MAVGLVPRWESPAAMRRRWLAGIFAVSVIWAVLVAVFSSDSVHRLWGVMAALRVRRSRCSPCSRSGTRAPRTWRSGSSFVGGLMAPLTWMAAKGLEQPEVWVVARSGSMLIHQGTPYASAAALAATQNPNAYNPYLPVMALFGLPRALFDGGLLTDPRIWFGVVFLVVFWLALRQGGARDPGRWAILVAGSPVIAFELAVGGTDVPMVGFLCLGFALLYRRPTSVNLAVLAGLALGIASAMKATAWPALVVAVVLIAVRDGRKAAWAFALTALGVVAVCVGPFFVPPEVPGGQHDQVPARARQRPVGRLEPAARARHRVDLALGRAHDRGGAAGPGRGGGRAVARVPAAALGAARGRAAGRGDDADVRAGAVDQVRLLHLPGHAGDLAVRRAGREPAGRPAGYARSR